MPRLITALRAAHPQLRRSLLVTAFLLALWTVVVALSKDGGVEALGVRLSAYRSDWPSYLAVALAVFSLALAGGAIGEDLRWVAAAFERRAPCVAGLAAIFAAGASAVWGSHAAGGADAYGYVSQADLWLRGQLVVPQPFAAQFHWPDLVFAPLGYRPGLAPRTIVPTYSPGFPMLMAAGKLVFGACGVYAVVPASAGLVAWMTFRLGALVWSRSAGAAAAVLVACSPTMIYMSMSPMSDVPVAAAWTTAMVWLLRPGRGSMIAAGLATAVTILIRPNLVPLAIVGMIVLALMRKHEGWRRALAGAFVYGVAVLPGVVVIAALNQHLYGSPLMSGHGELSPHFAWRHGPTNAYLYTSWLLQTQTPAIALAVAPFVFFLFGPRGRLSVPALVVLYGTIATVAASYLFFRSFDDWWWLRYWLAAFPALLVAMVVGAAMLLRRLASPVAVAAGTIGIVAVAAFQLHVPMQRGVFRPWTAGTRFEVFGRYVNEHTPDNAVILAMEHSGSLRYYGGRMTLRYDWIEDLDATVAELQRAGYRPYLALDIWERPAFDRRFVARSRLGRLDWPPVAEVLGPMRVRLYDFAAQDVPTDRLALRGSRRRCAPAASRVEP